MEAQHLKPQKNEREFSIGEHTFQLNKLNAFKQFHVVRRIAPILGKLGNVLPELAKAAKKVSAEQSVDQKIEEMAKFVEPIMNGLSSLSDADSEFVLLGLLSSVEVHQKQFNNWAKMATDKGLMFENFELPILLQCAGRAFMYNLSGFFASLPQR
jgi:hypothetical protein